LVTSISFNPAQPIGGQPFTAYVTVKNQGAGPGDGKYLDVWVNQPSVQSCGANGDQYQSVGTLTSGQSKIMTFNLTSLAIGAPWTFRAFVDSGCQTTESNDGNNQTTASYGANPVAQPDFLITSISTSPSSPKPGDAFTAYVTVKN
jgi:subtilase family serine protease